MATTNIEILKENRKLESMETPEQVLSASVARRRRAQTKKNQQLRNRTRDKTPIREPVTEEIPPERPTRQRSLNRQSDSDDKPSEEVIQLLNVAKRSLSSERYRKPTIERKTAVKRSQSTPRELPTDDFDLVESFKRAQRLSAEVGTSKLEYSPSRESIASDFTSTSDEEQRKQELILEKTELQKKLQLIKREKVLNRQKWTNSSETFLLDDKEEKTDSIQTKNEKRTSKGLRNFVKEFWQIRNLYITEKETDYRVLISMRNRCLSHLIIIFIFCGLGGMLFRFTEGAFENFYKCGVKRVKRDFIDSLWYSSHNLREEDWKSLARRKLMDFEQQLHEANEAGVHSYSGQKSWSFLNAIVYCFTVITTIGYGHITPTTTTGRMATIIYAFLGIPTFMILLTEFSKQVTLETKFWWGLVRRLYHTNLYENNHTKVYQTSSLKILLKKIENLYGKTCFKLPWRTEESRNHPVIQLPVDLSPKLTIDDNSELPVFVTVGVLLVYFLSGAVFYWVWEPSWSLFESFYFVFISMSTVGFGDFVPNNPIYMIGSLLYLIVGLALTSMCLTLIQNKLNDMVNQFSEKVSGTIGLKISHNDQRL